MRRSMSRLAVVIAAMAALGCGGSTQTITMKLTVSGQSLSIVATGNSNAVDNAKTQINQSVGSGNTGGASVVVTDGDTHDGNKVCETDVSDSGGTYHLVVYGASALITSSICDSLKSTPSPS